jgi:glutamate-1-semialdehyde 2,1-aminomutase
MACDMQLSALDRALRVASCYLPGGVSSNFRLGISPTPLVLERAAAVFLYDVDGNRLIDYCLGLGPTTDSLREALRCL